MLGVHDSGPWNHPDHLDHLNRADDLPHRPLPISTLITIALIPTLRTAAVRLQARAGRARRAHGAPGADPEGGRPGHGARRPVAVLTLLAAYGERFIIGLRLRDIAVKTIVRLFGFEVLIGELGSDLRTVHGRRVRDHGVAGGAGTS